MRKAASWTCALVSLATLGSACPASAQFKVTADTIREAQAPVGLKVIDVPVVGGSTPAKGAAPEQWFWLLDQYSVRNVSRPTLTVVPPKTGTGNGASVIVAPGGGFAFLSWSNEGETTARTLADKGITVFLLRYRTIPTPRDKAGYANFVMQQMSRARDPNRTFSVTPPEAIADATQAVRYVRESAAQWKLDPQRIGFIGFSAGASTGLEVATASDPAGRPNFVGLVYGPMRPHAVPASPPPLFAARAINDPLYPRLSAAPDYNFGLLSDWEKAGGSVELHLYADGGHGFGTQKNGRTTEGLLDQFVRWIVAGGWLKPASSKP